MDKNEFISMKKSVADGADFSSAFFING